MANLISYVYDITNNVEDGGWAPMGITKLWCGSIPYDVVNPLAILWHSNMDPSVGYLAFHSTQGVMEWGIDSVFVQTPYQFVDLPYCDHEGLCIHCGFDKAYNESGISRSLHEAMANTQLETLFIAGHSLGGTLAVLAALDLTGKTTARVPLVSGNIHMNTFGAPHVGNQTFVAHVEKVHHNKIPTLMQYYSEDDMVLTSPLPCGVASTLLYEHVGDFMYFRSPQPSLAVSHSISNYLPYARSVKLSSISAPKQQ
ncbi:class 3 lipase [Acanthamoeba castellanii str. Neff]|uniref:Class 3 lipase n=1 Tax=Acanthamoeba castellanii (strain ATCC 30010 / Neff) TaxID=1257118 RepID=L8H584_ACACF|nr:class 3 lipase [Acanthamoeba castellanii str. Neff]ELR20402.1 class 3 lipase [Acanthamoeba castellanii str. Neff]